MNSCRPKLKDGKVSLHVKVRVSKVLSGRTEIRSPKAKRGLSMCLRKIKEAVWMVGNGATCKTREM